MEKIKNNKKKNDNKYNADNEIIIGVTTKPKEKVRVEKKKTTRTNVKKSNNKIKNKSNIKRENYNKNNSDKIKKNKKQLYKEQEIKKLNIKRMAISIVIVLFLVICGTIYYLATPAFNIENIVVYGNEKNSIDTYISLSGLNINETNIFRFSKNSVKKRIKENSYVEDVRVERKIPNVVELYIIERKIDYKINYLNSYVYLNNQGYVLEISEEDKNILTIDGFTSLSDNIVAGQRLAIEDLIKLDTILKITNYLKYNSVDSKLTKIDATDEENYILEFKEENKIAYIGDSSRITEKMSSVEKILESEKGKSGAIYADQDALNRNRVYFREDNKEE